MCWFEWGVTTSLGLARALARASASCPGSLSVHMDGEPARLPVCRAAIADGTIPPGYAADDGVALLFRGNELDEVVSSRPEPPGACGSRPTGEELLDAAPARAPDRFGATAEIAEFRARARAHRTAGADRASAARPAPRPATALAQSICFERWKLTPSSRSSRPWAASRARKSSQSRRSRPADLGRREQPREDQRVDVGAGLGGLGPERGLDAEHLGAVDHALRVPLVASRTSTAPAQVRPSSVSSSYFWSR